MIAIIPARGGSKGLSNKNIKQLESKPLLAYTIEAAKYSKSVSRIILSTEDRKIAEIGLSYGAEVPFMRPSYLATDSSKSIDTYSYTITKLMEMEGITIHDFIVLQPTSPLRTAKDIDAAVEIFKKNNADSVISFCEQQHPISWHKQIDEKGRIIPIKDEKLRNRQNELITFYPNGAIYVFKTKIIEEGQYYTPNSFAYVMPFERSQDIDTIEDFELCEFFLQKNLKR